MKCEYCRTLIEEYFDGELNEELAEQVAVHVGTCAACGSLAAAIRQEQEIYANYSRDIEVTGALWAGVQAKIREEKQNQAPGLAARVREWFVGNGSLSHLSPAMAAAMVIVAIGVTVGVMSYLQSRNQSHPQIVASTETPQQNDSSTNSNTGRHLSAEQPNNAETTPRVSPDTPRVERNTVRPVFVKATAPVESDPARLVREAEQKYMAAIKILARDLNGRRRQLDPDTRARFDNALAEIDQTIYSTRQAVRRNPNDPIAIGYMLTAYSKKVDFLRDTARD